MGSLALGIGWGRAGSGEYAGFEPRYFTLVVPVWMIFIFTFDLYTSAVIRRVVLSFVLTAMLVLLWPTARDAIEGGRRVALLVDNFERDVRAGEPIYRLAKRYAPFLHPSQDVLADELTLLQKARIGVFGIIRPNPAFREIDVPVIPSDVRLRAGKMELLTSRGSTPSCTMFCLGPRPSPESASDIHTQTKSVDQPASESGGRLAQAQNRHSDNRIPIGHYRAAAVALQ